MKKIFLLFSLLFSLNLFSQKNIVKANPIGYLFKVYNISYERETFDKQSFSISIYDYTFSNYNGYAISSEYRFYQNDSQNLDGFFFSPSFLYSRIYSESTDFNKQSLYALNFNIGHQWILNSKLTFDYTVGFGYLNHDNYSGIGFFASISMGYAF